MTAFYRAAMRYASPILFIISLMIVTLSILEIYQSLEQSEALQGFRVSDFDAITRFRLLMSALGKSFMLAALPFAGAVFVHRLDRFLAQREPRA